MPSSLCSAAAFVVGWAWVLFAWTCACAGLVEVEVRFSIATNWTGGYNGGGELTRGVVLRRQTAGGYTSLSTRRSEELLGGTSLLVSGSGRSLRRTNYNYYKFGH